jgi:hypothetical protein
MNNLFIVGTNNANNSVNNLAETINSNIQYNNIYIEKLGGSSQNQINNVIMSSISVTNASINSLTEIVTSNTNDINTIIGGPTDVISPDLITARKKLVSHLGINLQTDIQTLSFLVDDVILINDTDGSNIETKIGDPKINNIKSNLSTLIGGSNNNISLKLGDPGVNFSSINTMIGGNDNIVNNLGNSINTVSLLNQIYPTKISIQDAISNIESMIGVSGSSSISQQLGNTGRENRSISTLIGGTSSISIYDSIVGSSGILNMIDGTTTDSGNINSKLTSQIQSIKGDSTQLSTAISVINNSLGSLGTLDIKVNNINSIIDGVINMNGLTSFTFTSAAHNSGKTISIIGNDGYSFNINTNGNSIPTGGAIILTNQTGSETITFINVSDPITSLNLLLQYLNTTYPVGSIIKSNTLSKLDLLKTLIGGTGKTLNEKTYNIQSLIGGTSTNITDQIGNPGTSSSIISNIGSTLISSQTSIQSCLDDISIILFNDTNFSTNLNNRIKTMNGSLDNGLFSLPSDSTYLTISSIYFDGNNGVNLDTNLGIYNINNISSINSIGTGNTFELLSSSGTLKLKNSSNNLISNANQMINYLTSMYPNTSTIAINSKDIITSINIMLGGSDDSSSRARIANIDRTILINPTGKITTDLRTIWDRISISTGATIEDSLNTINTLLDGTTSGSNVESRIETINSNLDGTGSGSNVESRITNIKNIIGNTGDIQSQLGTPDGNNDITLQNLIDGYTSNNLNIGLTNLRTKIDGSSGPILTNLGVNELSFNSYTGTTSQIFDSSSITILVNTTTIIINIGLDEYSYTVTSLIINNSIITFTGPTSNGPTPNKLLKLNYTGNDISNENAVANANELKSLLNSYFQVGSSITPGNLDSKLNIELNTIDGGVSSNIKDGLSGLDQIINSSSDLISGTNGTDFIVKSYTGIDSQIFASNPFSNSGSTTITVSIGAYNYTYNTGITTIVSNDTIRFVCNDKILLLQNNTGGSITGTDPQNLSNVLVGKLNIFVNGSILFAQNIKSKIDNISAIIGGTESDISKRLGDPIIGNTGISALIKPNDAINSIGIWNPTAISNFNNSVDIHSQIYNFLQLFNTSNFINNSDTKITFNLTGTPTSLVDLINMVNSTS